jgi:VWFA-related protein
MQYFQFPRSLETNYPSPLVTLRGNLKVCSSAALFRVYKEMQRGLMMKVPGWIGLVLPWIKRAALLALICPLLLAQPSQNVPPAEVHVSSRPWQPSVVHVQTTEIEVGVVVRDKQGRNIAGLNRQDFAIYDDGKQQELSHFTVVDHTPGSTKPTQPDQPATSTLPASVRETAATLAPPRPRYVALYFDDLHMPPGDVQHVQAAAENFLRTGLSQGDLVGLYTASGLHDMNFTADASKLLQTVPDLRSERRIFPGGGCPRISPYDAYLIANNLDPVAFKVALDQAIQCNCADVGAYANGCDLMQQDVVRDKARALWGPILERAKDTVSSLDSLVTYLAKMPGERVLVLSSSGFFTDALKQQVNEIMDAAIRAGIVINALDARGLFTTAPAHWRAQSDETSATSLAAMERVRREAETFGADVLMSRTAMIDFVVGTGGRFFRDRNDIGPGFYTLAAAPSTEYLLDFTPEKLDGKYHKLRVAVTTPANYDVQARPGYFAPKRDEAEPVTVQSRLDAAVMSDRDEAKFPSTATYQVRRLPSGTLELEVAFHVDLKKLPVVHQEDRSIEELAFVAALFDSKGGFVVGKQGEMDLYLKPETYERYSKEGIEASMVLPVEPGAYRLRTVVEEAEKGRIVARSEKISVH